LPEIIVGESDRIEWVLKSFRRQVQRAGILQEIRRRRHHVKPSAARALKVKAARRQRAKTERLARKRDRS
jgi:small subunit ribosomal protein S21